MTWFYTPVKILSLINGQSVVGWWKKLECPEKKKPFVIRIATGRYENIPLESHLCFNCNGIESEEHCLLH